MQLTNPQLMASVKMMKSLWMIKVLSQLTKSTTRYAASSRQIKGCLQSTMSAIAMPLYFMYVQQIWIIIKLNQRVDKDQTLETPNQIKFQQKPCNFLCPFKPCDQSIHILMLGLGNTCISQQRSFIINFQISFCQAYIKYMGITQTNPFLLFSLLLLYRLICSSLTRNYEYPDQYWQGPEVAHRLYFGYGYLTWEWTMDEPLRNPLYPYLLALGYWLNIGVWSVQALFAAVADFALVKIVQNIYGVLSGEMAMVIFTNWYYASTLTRTYANSFETCLTLVSFYLWVSGQRMGSKTWKDLVSRGLVCLSYVARPTSIMIWAIIWPYELVEILRVFGFSWKAVTFVFKNVSTIIFMFLSSFVIGSTYYGKPILTELNFLKYNFVEKWSQLYGKQSFLFYFGLSIPFIMGLGVLLLLISILNLLKPSSSESSNAQEKSHVKVKSLKIILFVSFTYLLISSFSTHKQHRFIFPIIPLLLILSCYGIASPGRVFAKYAKLLIVMIFLFNLAIFGLFSFYGKSDSVSVWSFIRQQMNSRNMNESNTVVIVLGESHFIPGVSMLHRNVTYQIPDSSALKMSKNESQNLLLSSDPIRVYDILTKNSTLKADFIIVQGKYINNFRQFLNGRNYEKVKEWRHCNIPEQTFIDYDSISVFQPKDRVF